MLKKLIAVVAAAAMVMGIGTTAFAAESKQETGYIEITAEYINTGLDADVDALCQGINNGSKTIADTGASVGSAVALTTVWDVHKVGNPTMPAQATTPAIDKLTSDYTNVRALHYDIASKAWEIIAADKVDYSAKTATFTFKSCSPVIIIADKAAASGSKTSGKASPATGSSTHTAAYATVAGILALAAVGFAMRRKKA